jgi:hypothetical protein
MGLCLPRGYNRRGLALENVSEAARSDCRRSRKYASEKFSLHKVLYRTPALVRQPLRFSIPTKPGHCPLQLARVRMGPW